jgi:hypothetical protein
LAWAWPRGCGHTRRDHLGPCRGPCGPSAEAPGAGMTSGSDGQDHVQHGRHDRSEREWRVCLGGLADRLAGGHRWPSVTAGTFPASTRYGSLRAPTRTLTDALSAALDAPTGVSQAAAFATVVGLRLAALRWVCRRRCPLTWSASFSPDVARTTRTPRRHPTRDVFSWPQVVAPAGLRRG